MAVLFDCPRLDCWQAYFQGTIPQEQRQFYERHLESCPDCQERLDRAEEYQDGLRHLGQQVGDPTQAPADPTLSQFVERLLEAKVPIQPPLGESADLYFLRPSECPGVLGTLGAYEVQEVIGRGGMGIVLKAFDPPLRRLVAIKVMAAAVAGSRTARLRFTREAHAAAAVCHDHVVPVHGVHEADGLPYLIMQYVPGESLQARLDRGGPLEVEEVVRIGMQTAAGLAAAHTQGLIHRDIKPANLLLEEKDESGRMKDESRQDTASDSSFILHPSSFKRVKITDFGLARMADDIGLTRSGVVAGTPEYMAPEQARGEQVDHRADLFSLGSVLYACCTGVPPFRGESVLAVLRGVNEEAPPPIHARNPEVPPWLKALVARLMAKDPAGRFHSAAEVATLLEGYLAHLRQPTVLSAPELPPPPTAGGLGLAAHGSGFGSIARFARRFWLPLFMLLLALGVGILVELGGAGVETGIRTESPQEYYQSLKGKPGDDSGLDLFGPEVDQCVLYEPAGLRITLPAGYSGERPSTGVNTKFALKGDFEITVGFEILREPGPAEVGKNQTRVSLEVVLDSPQFGVATLSRMVTGKVGKILFQTWQSVWNGVGGQKQERVDPFPTTAKSGRFRLVRAGAVLSYYVAENNAGDFTLLCQYPFSEEDLKGINLAGSTGDVTAALDVRFTDLRIRAKSLPGLPEAAPPKSGLRVWSLAALLFFLVTVPLAVWLVARRNRRAGRPAEPVPPSESQIEPAASPAISFPCPSCGKTLKVKPAFAGKKGKCCHCGQVALVPAPEKAQTSDVPASEGGPDQPGLERRIAVSAWLRRRRWLAALGLLAVLGLGLAVWAFRAGRQDTAPRPTASAPSHLVYDFRTKLADLGGLRLFGPDADSVATTDAQGLRITLPAGRKDTQNVGVEFSSRLRGNFAVDLGFELLALDDRLPKSGAGVQLRLTFDSSSPFKAAVTRLRKPGVPPAAELFAIVDPIGETFGAFRITSKPDGKETFQGMNVRAREPRGRLKLERSGPQLHYWVADGGPPYHLVRSEEIGLEEVESLQLFCFSSFAPVLIDARFTDLAIDTNSVPDAASGPATGPKGWLVAGLLIGLLSLVSLALAAWLYLRQNRRGVLTARRPPAGA